MLNLLIKLIIFEILVNIDCKNISAVFENDICLLVYMIRFSFLALCIWRRKNISNTYLFWSASMQEPLNPNESGRFGAVISDSTHHFFGNACTKSESLEFSHFSGCWLILSFYISMFMGLYFPFERLLGVR